MFEGIYNILVEVLGQSKQGQYIPDCFQYQFPCCRCIEEHGEGELEKYHLDINLKDGIFKCWKCATIDTDMQGKLGKLVKNYGGAELYKRYKEEVKEIR